MHEGVRNARLPGAPRIFLQPFERLRVSPLCGRRIGFVARGWEQPVDHPETWQRLMRLLGPVHDRAAATARRLGRSHTDGDDLLQETVLRAYEKLPSLRDEARFASWFYAVLLSVHRNRSRRSFWRRFLSLEGTLAPDGFDPPGENGVAWESERRQADRVSRVLACLPAVQREAVVLGDIEGYSIDEIAAFQGVSASAVKSRLARGRKRLRRCYARLGQPNSSPGLQAREEVV
jgi:RNA polymerase sigma-70 factor, ECF subfamily